MSGFNRAFRNLGAGPFKGPDAEGALPLLLCNVIYDEVESHEMQGAAPCRPLAGRCRGLSPRGIGEGWQTLVHESGVTLQQASLEPANNNHGMSILILGTLPATRWAPQKHIPVHVHQDGLMNRCGSNLVPR